MLAQTLRAIERDGMVTRTVHPEVPPRVEYRSTELGRSALEPTDVLCDWSARRPGAVEGARDRDVHGPGHADGADEAAMTRSRPKVSRSSARYEVDGRAVRRGDDLDESGAFHVAPPSVPARWPVAGC